MNFTNFPCVIARRYDEAISYNLDFRLNKLHFNTNMYIDIIQFNTKI